MIINYSFLQAKYDIQMRGAIHVGAHHGLEIPEYISNGAKKVVAFEPIRDSFEILKKYESENVFLFNCAIGDSYKKEVFMRVSSGDKACSSVLEPMECLIDHPTISFDNYEMVEMHTLDEYKNITSGCNYLSIDVQGYEYEVLLGAKETLEYIEYAYLEVNRGETYKGNRLVGDIDEILKNYNLYRVETNWESRTWGDAFYVKG